MRCILVILDGLGDRSYDVLGGRTPLQAAHTPVLDQLATLGMSGLYHPAEQGLALPSEEAHFLLFGYERSEFPGRGILEAIGYDIPASDDDVAVLAHFCEVRREGDRLILVRERAEVDESVLPPLQQDICEFRSGDIRIAFAPTKKIEGLLLLSGRVSPFFTDSDPMYEGLPLIAVDPLDGRHESKTSARAVSEYLRWACARLDRHPVNEDRRSRNLPLANALVTQRPGKRRSLPSFEAKWGLRALSIASGPVYWGLSDQTGIDVERVKDTDDPEADLRERLAIARDRNDMDFIHVHTKGPDEAAHTKDPHHKRDVIEALDRAMAVALDDLAPDPEIVLVVTADHSTPCSEPLIHSGETVPVTILGRNIRRDTVESFDEIVCAQGALGLVRGRELMCVILNLLDRAKLRGLMDTPEDQLYYPGKRRPLLLQGD